MSTMGTQYKTECRRGNMIHLLYGELFYYLVVCVSSWSIYAMYLPRVSRTTDRPLGTLGPDIPYRNQRPHYDWKDCTDQGSNWVALNVKVWQRLGYWCNILICWVNFTYHGRHTIKSRYWDHNRWPPLFQPFPTPCTSNTKCVLNILVARALPSSLLHRLSVCLTFL